MSKGRMATVRRAMMAPGSRRSPAPANGQLQKRLAPSPIVDRFPLQLGSNLSLAYLASAYRLCTQGWRYHFVDAISELIELDPHARGVTRQRVLPVAGARIEIYPAELPPNDPDSDLAKEIADEVKRQIDALPRRAQTLAGLAYGTVNGASGCEIDWDRIDDGWEVRGLNFIHSRRINYPNPGTWDVHIWDQGAVGPGFDRFGPTTGIYGLRVAEYPGKFVIHTPQLSPEYPTRDGEARYIGFYIALKRMIVRCSAQDFERTIRPWVLGLFNRELDKDRKTVANDDDIDKLEAAVNALGNGSLNSATLPDACKIEILRAASTYNVKEFLQFLNDEISKGMLGQTFTTQPGAHGNRSASETAKRGTEELNRYDAACLADTLERELIYWIVKLNYPGCERRLCPRLVLNTDTDLSPEVLMKIARQGAELDLPIDADDLAERTGLTLVPAEDKTKRRVRLLTAKDGPNPPDPDAPPPPDGGDETDGSADDAKPEDETTDEPQKAAAE